MDLIEQGQALTRILAKCRVDADFKSSLISDPVSVLRDGGVYVPDGIEIVFVPSGQEVPDSTQEIVYFSVYGLERDPEPLTEETLNNIAAGASNYCLPTANSSACSPCSACTSCISTLNTKN
jgi:hypothetical protein